MMKRPSLAERMKAATAQDERPAPAPRPAAVAAQQMQEPTTAAPKTGRAKSREGKKLLLIPIEPDLHKTLRHRCIDEGTTVEAFVRAAIADRLTR